MSDQLRDEIAEALPEWLGETQKAEAVARLLPVIERYGYTLERNAYTHGWEQGFTRATERMREALDSL